MSDTLIKFGPDVQVASYGGQGLSQGAQAMLAGMFLSDQVAGLAVSASDLGDKVANIGFSLKDSGIALG